MDMSFMSKFLVQGRDAGRAARPHLGQRRRRRRRARSPTRSGSTRAARSRPTSPSPSSTTSASGSSPPTPRTATSRPGCGGTSRTTRTRSSPTSPSGYAQLNVQGPRSRELLQSLTSGRPVERGVPVPRARARSTSASRACCACASPTSASSATSSTSRPSRRCTSTTGSSRRARAFGLRHAGPQGARQPAHGEGLPRLRPRHRQHRLGARGRPRLRRRPRQAGRLHRPRRGAGAEGGRAADAAAACRCWCKDPEPLLFHAEVVRRDGKPVGYVRAASYGHTLGGAVGLAMVEAGEPIDAGVARRRDAGRSTSPARRYPAIASLRPLYDPKNERVRG